MIEAGAADNPLGGSRLAVRGRPGIVHLLGGLVLVFFLVEIATGVLLLAYYRPTTEEAYYSVALINDEVRLGWLVRGLHSWGADLLLALAFLHLIRVYFAHGYAAPRQWTWVSGILLLVVLLGFGLTGTLLPWDQHAYWTVDAARESIQNVPLVGPLLLGLLWGGWEIGREVLLRFYVLHTGALPWAAAFLLAVHLALIWRFGVASREERGTTTPLAEVGLVLFAAGLVAVGVAATLVAIAPPLLVAPADPATPLLDHPPRWYLLPARPLLRGVPPGAAAVIVFGLFLFVTLLPFFDGRPIRSPWRRVGRWLLGVAALAVLVWLGTQVDAG